MLGPPLGADLRYEFDRLIDRGERAFMIDITHCKDTYLDVGLIGEIVAEFRRSTECKGSLIVVAMPFQREWFRSLALDSVICIVDNENEALAKLADHSDRERRGDERPGI